MASMSTFESLPDEILMLIFRFSGSSTIYSIFHSFSGLNQRFNNILVDRRLHLLADFLCIDVRASNFSDYYQSPQFTALSRRLGSLQSNSDKETELRLCLETLVSFHIQRKYHAAEQQFQADRAAFQSARANLTQEEIRLRDESLKKTFLSLFGQFLHTRKYSTSAITRFADGCTSRLH